MSPLNEALSKSHLRVQDAHPGQDPVSEAIRAHASANQAKIDAGPSLWISFWLASLDAMNDVFIRAGVEGKGGGSAIAIGCFALLGAAFELYQLRHVKVLPWEKIIIKSLVAMSLATIGILSILSAANPCFYLARKALLLGVLLMKGGLQVFKPSLEDEGGKPNGTLKIAGGCDAVSQVGTIACTCLMLAGMTTTPVGWAVAACAVLNFVAIGLQRKSSPTPFRDEQAAGRSREVEMVNPAYGIN
jgi:hypothetical protein